MLVHSRHWLKFPNGSYCWICAAIFLLHKVSIDCHDLVFTLTHTHCLSLTHTHCLSLTDSCLTCQRCFLRTKQTFTHVHQVPSLSVWHALSLSHHLNKHILTHTLSHFTHTRTHTLFLPRPGEFWEKMWALNYADELKTAPSDHHQSKDRLRNFQDGAKIH